MQTIKIHGNNDNNNQVLKPDVCSWLSATAWDNITELALLTNFHGLVDSFEQYWREWQVWYTCDTPETTNIPGVGLQQRERYR